MTPYEAQRELDHALLNLEELKDEIPFLMRVLEEDKGEFNEACSEMLREIANEAPFEHLQKYGDQIEAALKKMWETERYINDAVESYPQDLAQAQDEVNFALARLALPRDNPSQVMSQAA